MLRLVFCVGLFSLSTLQRYNLSNAKSSISGYFSRKSSFPKAYFPNIKTSPQICEGECFSAPFFPARAGYGSMADGSYFKTLHPPANKFNNIYNFIYIIRIFFTYIHSGAWRCKKTAICHNCHHLRGVGDRGCSKKEHPDNSHHLTLRPRKKI